MSAATRLRARQGDTLDLLLWRELGLGALAVATVLAANPGLADAGAILPVGQIVIVPAQPATVDRVALVQLWD